METKIGKGNRSQIGKSQNTNQSIDLEFIIESRLSMQSTQRFLEQNKWPRSIAALQTESFKNQYNNWPDFKKKELLQTFAGMYWKDLKNKIEK
jgi:hypothetical protein